MQSCMEKKISRIGQPSLKHESEKKEKKRNNTMENQLQMLSIRHKCVRSMHTRHPWRITMKMDLIYSSFTQTHSTDTRNYIECNAQR